MTMTRITLPLGDCNDEDLDAIIKAVNEEKESRKRKTFTSLPPDQIDFASVIEQAVHMHEAEMTNGESYDDDDNKHYLYEAVMEAVYGKDYFGKLRNAKAQG